MSCKQCDVLAADHDAEVKRLKASEETLIGVNKILGDEVTRLTNLAYSKDALLLSSQDEVTRLKAANAEMARRNGNLQERLAAADALIRDVADWCNADQRGTGIYKRLLDHVAQSPASEFVMCGKRVGPGLFCAANVHDGPCRVAEPSQSAPDVPAQLPSIERRLRLEIENRQALETELERLESRVTALEPKAEMPDWYDSMPDGDPHPKMDGWFRDRSQNSGWRSTRSTKPVPEPPLVTHAGKCGEQPGANKLGVAGCALQVGHEGDHTLCPEWRSK